MNIKTLILVIILSVLVGILIFFFTSFPFNNQTSLMGVSFSNSNLSPTPTPKSTLPPIEPNANLSNELNKYPVPDFEEDFDNLRNSI